MLNIRKNWKLNLLSLVFICVFTGLGIWQLSRAQEKRAIISSYEQRTTHTPYQAKDLSEVKDWRFFQAKLLGEFDNKHTFLLDNKIFKGKIGYEVYTPFKAKGLSKPILVDRGFIPLGVSREAIPAVPKTSKGSVVIQGMLNVPPRYASFGEMIDSSRNKWPMRIEYVNLGEISTLLNSNFFPYVLTLAPESPSALQVKWQIVTMDPNKHMGYAVQWFAIALTLLIISVFLNRTPKNKKRAKI